MKIVKIKNLLILSTISLSSVGTCTVALTTTSCSKVEYPNPSAYSLHFSTLSEITSYHPVLEEKMSGEHYGEDTVDYLGKHFNSEMACVSIWNQLKGEYFDGINVASGDLTIDVSFMYSKISVLVSFSLINDDETSLSSYTHSLKSTPLLMAEDDDQVYYGNSFFDTDTYEYSFWGWNGFAEFEVTGTPSWFNFPIADFYEENGFSCSYNGWPS